MAYPYVSCLWAPMILKDRVAGASWMLDVLQTLSYNHWAGSVTLMMFSSVDVSGHPAL